MLQPLIYNILSLNQEISQKILQILDHIEFGSGITLKVRIWYGFISNWSWFSLISSCSIFSSSKFDRQAFDILKAVDSVNFVRLRWLSHNRMIIPWLFSAAFIVSMITFGLLTWIKVQIYKFIYLQPRIYIRACFSSGGKK